MIIEIGERVHLVVRRMFDDDLRRHFVGEVTGVSDAAMRLDGYSFIFDQARNTFQRISERRERIFPLADARVLITILPGFAEIDLVHYALSERKQIVLTDGKNFSLAINEFGSGR